MKNEDIIYITIELNDEKVGFKFTKEAAEKVSPELLLNTWKAALKELGIDLIF